MSGEVRWPPWYRAKESLRLRQESVRLLDRAQRLQKVNAFQFRPPWAPAVALALISHWTHRNHIVVLGIWALVSGLLVWLAQYWACRAEQLDTQARELEAEHAAQGRSL